MEEITDIEKDISELEEEIIDLVSEKMDDDKIKKLCHKYEKLLNIEEKLNINNTQILDDACDVDKPYQVDLSLYDNFFTSDVVNFLGNQFTVESILMNKNFSKKKYLKIKKQSTVFITVYNEGINNDKSFGCVAISADSEDDIKILPTTKNLTGTKFNIGTFEKIKFEFYIKTDNYKFTTSQGDKHLFVEQNVEDENVYRDNIKHYILTWEDDTEVINKKFNKFIIVITIEQNNKMFNNSCLTNK